MPATRWAFVGACCSALAALLTPPAAVIGAESAWAVETFVDVTESDGRVLSVELRRPCGASVAATALAFCDEFAVPPPDCERLAAFLDGATPANASNACLRTLPDPIGRRRKLGVFTLSVDDTNVGTTKRMKIAIHEGDAAVLDERMRYLCGRFQLVGASCPLLRRHLEAEILDLEVASAREQLRQVGSGGDLSPAVGRGVDAYERVLAHLLSDRRELHALVDDKASAYKRLQSDSKRELLGLRRRVRLLETELSRLDATPSRVPRPPRAAREPHGKAFAWIHGERARRIPRVRADSCSYSEYLRLARASTPVIFTGFRDLPHSPGLPNWTFETLASECGDARVALKKSVFGADADAAKASLASQHYWAGMAPSSESTLAAFLADAAAGGSSELYLHDASIAGFCPSLLDAFYVPRFFAEDRMQRVYSAYNGSVDFDDVGAQQRDYWPSLFIGGEATASSLHGDWGGTAAWMGLLEGRKHWVIASPATRAVLHEEVPTASRPAPGRFGADLMCKLMSDADDVEWTDVLRRGELFEDVLEAGEVLFIPAESPHQVRNLEMTVAVAVNFVDSANAHHFAAFLRQEMLSSSKDKHRALAKLLRDLETLQSLPLPAGEVDLPFHEFKQQQQRP